MENTETLKSDEQKAKSDLSSELGGAPEKMDDYIAVFNSWEKDRDKARKLFRDKFGKEEYVKQIKPFFKKGLMSIFQTPPNKYTKWYVKTLAVIVNKRNGASA